MSILLKNLKFYLLSDSSLPIHTDSTSLFILNLRLKFVKLFKKNLTLCNYNTYYIIILFQYNAK